MAESRPAPVHADTSRSWLTYHYPAGTLRNIHAPAIRSALRACGLPAALQRMWARRAAAEATGETTTATSTMAVRMRKEDVEVSGPETPPAEAETPKIISGM